MARELMDAHGLSDWRLAFDNAKKRAGVCIQGRRTISLSRALTQLHDEAEVRDTILHEIAHALVGPEHGHGPVWRETALRIGCTGERCVSEDAPRVRGAWQGTCPSGHTKERHRRPERVLLCTHCRGVRDAERVFEWTFHGRPARMHPNYLAELKALRSGTTLWLAGPGHRVRIIAAGPFQGAEGTVVKRGRTRYLIRLDDNSLVKASFAIVEFLPAEADAESGSSS